MTRSRRFWQTSCELEDRLAPSNTPPELVRDIHTSPPATAANPGDLTDVNGTLFFRANSPGVGVELWKSDGTSAGTKLVRDIRPGSIDSYPFSLTNVNGTLFFFANDGLTGYELWRSNGTSTGTTLVRDLMPGPTGFFGGYVSNAGGALYFSTNLGATGYELWRSDGTSTGTVVIANTLGSYFTEAGGVVFFSAGTSGTGRELWRTDGTSSGTMLVRDILSGPDGSTPRSLINFNGTLFFTAYENATGYELWRSDGTSSGTTHVRDIAPGPDFARPNNPVVLDGKLYFRAYTSEFGSELWRSDGTSTGTVLVRDIHPGSGNSSVSYTSPGPLTVVGSALFFQANDGATGPELWRSNGASTGTTLVRDMVPGSGYFSLNEFTNVNGALYFRARDFTTTDELWRSDGTSAATSMLDLEPGPDATPYYLRAIGELLYFSAFRSDVGRELFKVREDSTPPAIGSITSATGNGTFSTGQSINVTVNFGEAVTLTGGNLNVTLDIGAVVSIAPFSGPGAAGIYLVQAGHSSPDLNVTSIALATGATLKDAAGNPAILTLPASNLGVTANIIVNPPAPTTVSFSVNQSATQRSRLTRIDLTFGAPVNAAFLSLPGVISLTRTQPGAGPKVDATNGLLIAPTSGMTSTLTLTFSNILIAALNYGSLADGRWQLSIPYLNYQSPLNDPSLRRLFGDANNDGTIDGNDLADFGIAFGSTGTSAFDFNADGTVDALDFGEFGNRFGITL